MKIFDIKNLVRPNIAGMLPYSSARDEFTDFNQEMVFLDANESPFDNGVNRYPDPQQLKLKELLAHQKGISTANLLLGNGSDEVLDLLFRAFCIPGQDNVITLPPTYGMYKVLCATNDIENREVLLNNDFQPDVTAILNQVSLSVVQNNKGATKLIFFCSPNNPTGNLIEPEKIISILEQFNGIVVIDEAYIDFAAAESWVSQLSNFPNLIVTQTLSKAYGMAAIRLGLAFASSEIIAILNKIKPPYNVNELTQRSAYMRVAQLDQVEKEVDTILDNRERLISALKNIDFVTEIFPTDTNFVLARVDNANKRYNQLIQKGIVVRNRSTQPLCENTLRFTVGTSEENIILINALNSI